MRLFGVGGRRDWNSDKVLILSPMGMLEEGSEWNFGGVESVAASLTRFVPRARPPGQMVP